MAKARETGTQVINRQFQACLPERCQRLTQWFIVGDDLVLRELNHEPLQGHACEKWQQAAVDESGR